MSRLELSIISQLQQLEKVDLRQIWQSLDYSASLELTELKTALRLQNQKTLTKTVKQLEQNSQRQLEKQAADNLQLLESWKLKQQTLVSQLQENLKQAIDKLAKLFNFEQKRAEYLSQEIIRLLNAENLYDEAKVKERDLKIKLSFNDYVKLSKHFSQIENKPHQLNYSWVSAYLLIDHELTDGLAILEDKYTLVYISLAEAEKTIDAIFNQLSKPGLL